VEGFRRVELDFIASGLGTFEECDVQGVEALSYVMEGVTDRQPAAYCINLQQGVKGGST
jgi:hypothetical protein